MIEELKPCPFCGCQATVITGAENVLITGSHSASCPFRDVDVIVDGREAWNSRAELAELEAGQGEAVAWQFLDHDGKWYTGSDRNNHRQNTEDAGYQIRELFVAPPAFADARLGELLERVVEHLEYDAIGSPSEAIAGDLAKELRALLAQSESNGVKS